MLGNYPISSAPISATGEGSPLITATEIGIAFAVTAALLGNGALDATEAGLSFDKGRADLYDLSNQVSATEVALAFGQGTAALDSNAALTATEIGIAFSKGVAALVGGDDLQATEIGLVFGESAALSTAPTLAATETGLAITVVSPLLYDLEARNYYPNLMIIS